MMKHKLAIAVGVACLAISTGAAAKTFVPFQPKETYTYGWQGKGNYITAEQLKDVENKVNAVGSQVGQGNPTFAKAVCTVELAKWTYREVNTKGTTEYLAAQALKLADMAQNGEVVGFSEQLPSHDRMFADKWAQLETLKDNQCAAPIVSCADVALLGAEYEYKEEWKNDRHGGFFLKRFDSLMRQANEAAQSCQVPESVPEQPQETVSQLSLNVDALFKFDNDKVIVSGYEKLHDLALALNTMNVSRIVIKGHTDYLGDDAYNMALSQRRAETVRDFLVGSTNVSAGVIEAIGVGETEPVVQCHETNQKALKQCLQPNRRVTIEVHGIQQNQ